MLRLDVKLNDWGEPSEDDNITSITCSYDGGRFNVTVNGVDIVNEMCMSHDVAVDIDVIQKKKNSSYTHIATLRT